MAVSGMKVAFLATNGVEQVELTKPYEALKQEGAEGWRDSGDESRPEGRKDQG